MPELSKPFDPMIEPPEEWYDPKEKLQYGNLRIEAERSDGDTPPE